MCGEARGSLDATDDGCLLPTLPESRSWLCRGLETMMRGQFLIVSFYFIKPMIK